MLYDKAGTPLPDVLREAALRVQERAGYRRPSNYFLDPGSNDRLKRAYRIGKTRNGDPYPIFRVGVQHRPGRGYAERQAAKCA